MKAFSRKRLLLVGGALISIGAATALVAGATFGFFSSAGVASGSNTFTAGHVVVGLDSGGTQVTCAIGPMSAGDTQAKSGNVSCEYDVKYTGNVKAFMALDLAITGAPGTPIEIPYGSVSAPAAAQGLYDGTANGLQFSITDGASTSYLSGTQYNNQAGTATTLTPTSGSASIADLLVTATPITTNATTHVTVTYTLPTSAGNAYNLATSSIVLTVHAVQADNNALPVGCAAGHVCSSGMNWS
jgi:hypothetical protein